MAVNTENLDWENWRFEKNPFCVRQTSNPLCGFGGETVYQQVMEQNNQTSSTSMTADGQMNICNDACMTLVGGVKNDGGNCLNIIGKNGDVTITAEMDGSIKIKGSSVLIDADKDLVLNSRQNVYIKGSSSIFFDTPNLATNALTGNLAPRDVTFGGLVFRGTKVGGPAISDAFTGGVLENLQEQAQKAAGNLQNQLGGLTDKLSEIDTGALTEQLGGVTEGLQGQLGGLQGQLGDSLKSSGLKDALDNFGGFT